MQIPVAVVGLAALSLQSACYSYQPPPSGDLPTGGDVQVELTTDGSSVMQPAIGPRIHYLEGRVQRIEGDGSAFIAIESVTSREGLTLPYTGRDAVRVPRGAMLKADVRTLDRTRTWWTAGIISGVFTIVVVTALEKARSRNSGSAGRISASAPELRVIP